MGKQPLKSFVGYGDDIVTEIGLRFCATDQQKLKIQFLKTIKSSFSGHSINECICYFHIAGETALGKTVTIKDLTAEMMLPRSTASYVVNSLQNKGLVECSTDPHDRRRKLVSLSPAFVAQNVSDENPWDKQFALLESILAIRVAEFTRMYNLNR